MISAIRIAFCSVAAVTAVPSGSPPPVLECSLASTAGVLTFTDSVAAQLSGTYRLVFVNTTYPDTEPLVDSTWTVTLTRTDTVERARAAERRIGRSPRVRLQLVGTVNVENDPRTMPAEVDDGVLYLGCRDCLDGSPTVVRVAELSSAGFWGTWRDYQTGIAYVIDRQGKRAPDPAGYVCGIRLRVAK